MHSGRDGANHIAGLRQGQYRDYLAKTIRHLLRGEKSITEEGHRHNNIGIKHIIGSPYHTESRGCFEVFH